MRLLKAGRLVRVLAVGVLGAQALIAQERPLPDQESFLREARKRLQTDASLQSSYVYRETRREQKLDSQGRVQEESVKVFESYPGLPGEPRWDQLISENGKPRPAPAIEEELRDRQKKAEAIAREMIAQPAKAQARQQREYQEQRKEFDAILDDLFLVYEIRMQRRELLNGHATILVALTPRRDAKPRTREGDQMRNVSVRAWISEAEYELVRVEAEVVDTLSIGLGLLARLHKGAQLSFVRTKVNDEVWLPARFGFSGSARVGLIAVLRRAGSSEYSGYRKFSVDTSTTYQTPTP
jgi:hypothetical protein